MEKEQGRKRKIERNMEKEKYRKGRVEEVQGGTAREKYERNELKCVGS